MMERRSREGNIRQVSCRGRGSLKKDFAEGAGDGEERGPVSGRGEERGGEFVRKEETPLRILNQRRRGAHAGPNTMWYVAISS